ncbi:MAG: hypothetical protein NZV14_20125, partial [Bryobacteraceae bacterium]|nr:hypothetical protein [Bryobacteraceae bacterium]MDW8380474.1 hypothetical protein [Bryobacterales bacterium]
IGEGVIGKDLQRGTCFRLLLTSECIVRDPKTGQIDPVVLPEVIGSQLGGRVHLRRSRWAFHFVGGFNQKWRMELPQARAVAAGSVLLFEATDNLTIDDLLALEHEGIGERRTEGFGRFTFLDTPVQQVMLGQPRKPEVKKPSTLAPELAKFIEYRLLQSLLRRKIEYWALQAARNACRIPSPSLLGRLRVALRSEPSKALQTLAAWLGQGDDALRRPARDQLMRCQIGFNSGRLSLADWLRNLVEKDQWAHLKTMLSLAALVQQGSFLSNESALQQLEQKSDEIAMRLIDATLAALAKQRKRKEAKAR